jgi:hypothetical protein
MSFRVLSARCVAAKENPYTPDKLIGYTVYQKPGERAAARLVEWHGLILSQLRKIFQGCIPTTVRTTPVSR